jgi:arylsulfatase A-like enzyme
MLIHDNPEPEPGLELVTIDPEPRPSARKSPSDVSPYRPSSAFRRILNRGIRSAARAEIATHPGGEPGPAPSPRTLIAAAMAVGVVSGLLELFILAAQRHMLHYVDWSTLMISHHVGWMIPITGASIVVVLTIVLVWPALAAVAWRRRATGRDNAPGWAWDWAGWVLGTLLFLGPLLTIRGFHFAAPLAVALGFGFRIRRWLVRPTPTWPRRVSQAARIALVLMATHLAWQFGGAASGNTPTTPSTARNAPNLLWIVLDTLRADRMSLHGYSRPTTPELEAWARLGITFDMARSAAPWTLPSHVTMFTGLWPSEHGACIDRAYAGSSPTLAEHLRAQGYVTAGIAANVRMCNSAYGLGRGFDWYVDYPCKREISLEAAMNNSALGSGLMEIGRRLCLPVPAPFPFYCRRSAPAIAAEGLAWLESATSRVGSASRESERPFFLFLNFMDVHGPYLPHPDVPRRFWTGPAPSKKNARPEDGWIALQGLDSATPDQLPRRVQELENARSRLGDLYDDCLTGLDAHLGQLLGRLHHAGLLDETWIVVTADHGEHLGEHGQFGHGSSLYNELTHVPLVLIPPLGAESSDGDLYAGIRNRRIRVPVSQRDLPRTLTELLLPGVKNPFPGRSLARLWAADHPEAHAPVVSQLEEPRLKGNDFRTSQVGRIESIIGEDRVLIDYSDRPSELFALAEDPEQQRNLADFPSERPRLDRLKQELEALHQRSGTP